MSFSFIMYPASCLAGEFLLYSVLCILSSRWVSHAFCAMYPVQQVSFCCILCPVSCLTCTFPLYSVPCIMSGRWVSPAVPGPGILSIRSFSCILCTVSCLAGEFPMYSVPCILCIRWVSASIFCAMYPVYQVSFSCILCPVSCLAGHILLPAWKVAKLPSISLNTEAETRGWEQGVKLVEAYSATQYVYLLTQ